ncbi:transmembrane protein 6/97 [Podospora didyma]|uniref:Efficient mitochondria targeting-associated protein 19 n=1 Tax=Podospora didyma TaxID=330526 RepID=A0AAE0U4Z5_9PEZI|nr:transmembrane protein 6/97 [Podospora didyma]
MTTYNTSALNYTWLVWLLIQVPIILLIDGLHFLFPSWVYELAGSPLHFAHRTKQDYITSTNDAIAQWSPEGINGENAWIGFFLYAEIFTTLPVVLYAIWHLGVRRRGTSGATELVLLVYGYHVALSTAMCIYSVLFWDPAVYSREAKRTLILQYYAPWLAVPTLIFFDMASRLFKRFRAADAALATKKVQ